MTVSVASEPLPCGGCQTPTKVRIGGEPGHFVCLTAPAEPAPAEPAAVTGMRLRFLADLETTYKPMYKRDGKMMGPWWRPPLPEVMDLVQTSTWAWSREHTGAKAVLDRSGAWIAGASSVDVAPGQLVQVGPCDFADVPGIYKTLVHPWTELGVPHPLGGAAMGGPGSEVWVPHTRMRLLAQLAAAGRWPDATAIDSYQSNGAEKVRLNKWSTHVNTVRGAAITKYGRDSEEYDAVKTAFSQAIALMLGSRDPGKGRVWQCAVHRPDWALSVQDLTAVTLWRWADDCHEIAHRHGRPDLAPVELRNVDELVIPVDALDLVTTTKRANGTDPMPIDDSGIRLGTFKVKAIES